MNESRRDYTGKAVLAAIVWFFTWPIGWWMASHFLKDAERLEDDGYTVEGQGCLSAIVKVSRWFLILAIIVIVLYIGVYFVALR